MPVAHRTAVFSIADLWRDRAQIRREVIAACTAGPTPADDADIHDATMKEAAKGWLEGPLTAQELDKIGLWITSRRFAVRQAGKLIPIDDYTASRVNDALSSAETISPADVDHIVANARLHADALAVEPEARASASPFAGRERHADHVGQRLLGRMFDIAIAYKQLAV